MEKLKFLLVVIIIWLFWLNWVSAFDEHRKVVEEYIESVSTFDHFWKWKNPHISSEKSFFSHDDSKPSYIEYKVSCDKQIDCWYVMVNIDWTNSPITESSSIWKTSSEMMAEISWEDSKNYYFSVLEQFSENKKTWKIWFINLEDDINDNKIHNILSKKSNENLKLKIKLDELKKQSFEKYLNTPKITTYDSNKVSLKNVSWWTWAVVWTNYISELWCFSYTPCYVQYKRRDYSSYFDVEKNKVINLS